jgi:cytochrome c-type biogenesis protein CcmF
VFLANNLLFTLFTFTVLLGTLFPLVAEAVRGVKVSVGAPFFNRMTIPLCVALLFLVGVGPALPWRGGRRDQLKRALVPSLTALVVTVAVSFAIGVPSGWAIAAFAFAAFAMVTNVQEYARGVLARRRAHGESWPQALYRLMMANNRRYGGYMAHIGAILIAVGITASSAYRLEREVTLNPGQSVEVGDYLVRFDQVEAFEEPHRWVIRAQLTAFSGSRELGVMDPRLNFYNGRAEPITTPAVRSRPNRDLYLNLLAFERDGSSATFSVIVEPLVFWIWFGGFVVAIGGLIAILPPRRRTPRRAAEKIAVEVA